jgi:hypothetical protein
MWAMLSDIARAKPGGRDLTTDKWKALFMDAIGIPADWEPGINGGVVNVGYRSSRLTKEQMSDMIEQMYAYGAEHGVEWSEPSFGVRSATTPGRISADELRQLGEWGVMDLLIQQGSRGA